MTAFTCFRFMRKVTKCMNMPFMFFLLISASTFATIYFAFWVRSFYYHEVTSSLKSFEESILNHFLQEKGRVCKMPKLNPFASKMMKYLRKVDKIVCEGQEWVECNLEKCRIKDRILNKMKKIECIYNDIIIVDDYIYYLGPEIKVFDDQPYILKRSDIVKVSCKRTDRGGLLSATNRWGGYKVGFRPVEVPPTKPEDEPLNILLLLFDSPSRNSFIRCMPLSLKYLTEELNAVVMNSYSIVGDSTAKQLLPMLTGHNYLELQDASTGVPSPEMKKLDLKYFIFHLLKTYGYRTAYFEDYRNITLNYPYDGFKKQPADHYSLSLFQKQTKLPSYTSRNDKCMGSVPFHRFLFNLTEQFFQLPGKKFCMTCSSRLSRDDPSLLKAADGDLVEFLKGFQSWGRNDTLLFVMSDHGIKASISNTYRGRLEERLPFLSVTLPKYFKNKRPIAEINLKANSETLITPYDVHATMLDYLGLNQYRIKKKVPGSELERELSFFEPIPINRTCAEAYIMPYYCACTVWHNVTITEFNRTGMVLTTYYNDLTSERTVI